MEVRVFVFRWNLLENLLKALRAIKIAPLGEALSLIATRADNKRILSRHGHM
ncbi:hypothetical protein COCC4DRAFT_32712 [Bipolaris maydis ATCC 48331]|uniref:Uncharacterized protein n=2 Tax=Cochliobolus heterostrophus TaxID=5016 RepID=M2UGJ8_COCH5|nr:uncharacterized protein COCC4DRAFT_32712 [Bipolaris maydis ATCC 48331]EMD87072.1 hypothetical protein COCHEDRAFT_1023786 [Bipolaris maydis C5]ENI03935.1 hypothetical protein COCC4DRAFT_32712 [Bipolaris maydis ATCC 48331]